MGIRNRISMKQSANENQRSCPFPDKPPTYIARPKIETRAFVLVLKMHQLRIRLPTIAKARIVYFQQSQIHGKSFHDIALPTHIIQRLTPASRKNKLPDDRYFPKSLFPCWKRTLYIPLCIPLYDNQGRSTTFSSECQATHLPKRCVAYENDWDALISGGLWPQSAECVRA